MALITTAQAGNWSNTATWTGGVLPAATDDIQIDHALTVDGAYTCTNISQATTGPLLTIPDTRELIFRGYINPRNSGGKKDVFMIAAGGTLTFDAANQSGANAGRIFGLDSFTHGVWACNGTLAKPVTIRQTGSGANRLRIDLNDALNRAGSIWPRFAYVRFEGVGSASVDAIYQSIGYGQTGNAEVIFDNCVFDAACGRVQLVSDIFAGSATGGTVRFLDTVHKGGDGIESLRIGGRATGATQAVIQGGFYAQRVAMFGGEGWTVDGSVWWASQTGINNSGATKTAAFQNVVRRAVANDVHICLGDETNVYDVIDISGVGNNPHPVVFNGNFDCAINGNVVDGRIAGDIFGDVYAIPSTVAPHTYTVRNTLMVPNSAGKSIGKLVSMLGDAGVTVVVEHNTFVSDRTGNTECGFGMGETYNGHVGMYASVKSNLAYSPTADTAVLIAGQINTNKVSNIAQPASVTNNATWNGYVATSTGVRGYHDFEPSPANPLFSGGSPGANDKVVAANPFVDSTRNIATWSASLGGAATVAGAGDILRRAFDWTDGGFDPSAARKPAALLTWVKDGFRVTDPLLNNAGHDGVTIGAMPYSAVAAGPTIGASPPTTIVHGGSLNLPIVNADAGDRTVAIIQGAVTLPLAETGGTNSNIIVPTVTLEQVDPLTSMRRVFDTQAENAIIRVTRTSDSATVDHPIRVIDPVNQTHGNPIVTGGVLASVPPWIVGDQLQARGPGGGALPADFTIYGDGNVGASASGNFEYRVYDSVTNTVGAWALATVSVGVAPSITAQPTNQTVSEGATATFSVVATGDAPLAYQWQKNLSNIVGATSATYVTPVTVIGDNGSTYRCVVTNAYGIATSNTATLTVSGVISPPGPITGLAVTAITTTGATVSYNSTPTATSYEYTLDGTNYIDVGLVLTFALTGLSQYTNYSVGVRAKNGSGVGAQSSSPFRTLDGIAPSQPQDLSTPTIGTTTATVAFTAATDNVAVTGYRYRVNGGSWINIGLSYSFSISGLSPGVAQLVEIVAYDAAGNTGFPASINFTTLTLSATPMTIGEIRFHVLHKIWRFVNEGSSINVRVFFRNGRMSATPISVRYRLSCEDTGQCLLDWTSTTPAAQVDLVIPASFNTLISQWHFFERRTLTVEATSIDGNVQIGEYTYFIRNIIGVH